MKTIQEKKKLFNMFKRDEIKTLAEMVIYEEHREEEFIKILSKSFNKQLELKSFVLPPFLIHQKLSSFLNQNTKLRNQ